MAAGLRTTAGLTSTRLKTRPRHGAGLGLVEPGHAGLVASAASQTMPRPLGNMERRREGLELDRLLPRRTRSSWK